MIIMSVETELAKVAELHNVKKKDGMMSMFPFHLYLYRRGEQSLNQPLPYMLII
jgi:copper(I)-binding protein